MSKTEMLDADRLMAEIRARERIAPGYAMAVIARIAGEARGLRLPDMLRREPMITPDART